MPSIYLDDTAIEDMGMILYEGAPYLGGFTRTREHTPWPGRAGTVAASQATTGPRLIRMVVDVPCSTPAQRTALLDLYGDLLTGTKEVRYADAPDRVMRGQCRVFEADIPVAPRWVNLEPRVVVEIECPIAHRWDAQPQSRVLSSTPTPIPVGTLAHGGLVTVMGASAGALSTTTTLRYRGISGVVLGELTLTPALLAGEYALIDLNLATITKVSTAGVRSDAYAWKTGGGTWFKLYPRDGTRALGAWPTLELTAGSGLYVFRRNWVS
jgi:hypothetical protein